MNLIAHYTSAKTAIEKILPNESLRFSELKNTNDPWEFKKNIYAQLDENILNLRNNFKKMDEVNAYFENIKSISFTNDFLKEEKRCFCNPLMWSHYGNNHKGICLIFDRDKLKELVEKQFENKIIKLDRVSYNNKSKKLVINNKTPKKELIQEMIFKKDSVWEYEEEYRFVIEPCEEETYLKDISFALRAIVLGGNFPDAYQCVIKNLHDSHYKTAELLKIVFVKPQKIKIERLSDDSIPYLCHKILTLKPIT